jgi:hypothetical protein
MWVVTAPLAVDLFCGLGGWTEGLLAEGYDVVGFDIERHEYGGHRYPGQLIIRDVLTLHGSQFKDATLIVASPPCQEYSYMAMPWKRAKAKAAAIRADETGNEFARLNRLFNACLRIQLEASVAAGRHVPMVIENVKGAQPWVGRARWSFGSFYLWGDVPALMPVALRSSGVKAPGMNWSDQTRRGQDFTGLAGKHALAGVKGQPYDTGNKNNGGSWFAIAHNTTSGKGQNPDGRKRRDDDGYPRNHPSAFGWKAPRTSSRDKTRRKFASAMIAKIPLPLSRHIAATYRNTPS